MGAPANRLRRVLRRAGVFAISAFVTCAFIINLCALVYGCGCHSWWNGAADSCNIHDEGAHHCPWCSIGTVGFYSVEAGILAVQALLSFGPWPRGISCNMALRLLASLAAFPITGLVIGIVLGVRSGYWS
jgi:hypothetical protein